jgi:hypothetical protein
LVLKLFAGLCSLSLITYSLNSEVINISFNRHLLPEINLERARSQGLLGNKAYFAMARTRAKNHRELEEKI